MRADGGRGGENKITTISYFYKNENFHVKNERGSFLFWF